MIRTVLAVLVGLVVAVATIFAVQWLAVALFPPPQGFALENEDDLRRLIGIAPPGMFLVMLFGWVLTSFLGAWVAARIAQRKMGAAIVVGCLIVVGLGFAMWELPYPRWVALANVLIPIPLAWCAARLAISKTSPQAPLS